MVKNRRGTKPIGRVRALGERPFSVNKRVFHDDLTMMKTLEHVLVKEIFKHFVYDFYQLVTLDRKRLVVAM